MKKKMLEKLNKRIITLDKRLLTIGDKWEETSKKIRKYETLSDAEFNDNEYHRLCEYNNKLARVYHDTEDVANEYKKIERFLLYGMR